MNSNREEIVPLKNGLVYKLIHLGEFCPGEYPSGGIKILRKHGEDWHYIDNAPDENCVLNFLAAAERLQN